MVTKPLSFVLSTGATPRTTAACATTASMNSEYTLLRLSSPSVTSTGTTQTVTPLTCWERELSVCVQVGGSYAVLKIKPQLRSHLVHVGSFDRYTLFLLQCGNDQSRHCALLHECMWVLSSHNRSSALPWSSTGYGIENLTRVEIAIVPLLLVLCVCVCVCLCARTCMYV